MKRVGLLTGVVWFAFGTLAPSVAVAAPTPVLSGVYQVGELGLVEFSVLDGKVIGKVRQSQQCIFPPDTQVVSGTFEGGVFVGSVTLCQEGNGCAQKTYPMLGVYHVDSIAAFIHLDSGCSSRALDRNSLFLRPATLEEKQRLVNDNSAMLIASKGKTATQIAAEEFAAGKKAIDDNKFDIAREHFKRSLELDPTPWQTMLGFGNAEIRLGRPQVGLEYVDKALNAATTKKESAGMLAQIHYNRACAQVAVGDSKAAIASLRQAVKLGGAANFVEGLATDPDFNKIREDKDFKQLYSDTFLAAKKKGR
ncbi:MAG: hypothetical protein U0228_20160 [Myxococcaceae bacterium]